MPYETHPQKESLLSENVILASLSAETYQRLLPHLKTVKMPHGQVFYEIDDHIDYIYFPFNALISLVLHLESGLTVEVGLVGRDGVAGVTALMGIETASVRTMVQVPGDGMQVKKSFLQEEFDRGGELQKVLLQYVATFIKQVTQTAACNGHHTIEERLARWLLMCHERVQTDELNLTHEFIANMLGSRRATVSTAMGALQLEGLIQYKHGRIRIIDRQGLEDFSCECFKAVK